MKTLLIIGIFFLLFSSTGQAQSTLTLNGIYSGNQLWNADTIKISGDVTVIGNLNIAPGTYIEFLGYYELKADTIFAMGGLCDSITFTINDTTGFSRSGDTAGGWKGIRATYVEIDYCRIMFIKNNYLIYILDDIVDLGKIRNSVFENNSCKEFIISDHYWFWWCYYSENKIHIEGTSFENNNFSLGWSVIIDSCRFTGNNVFLSGSIQNSYFRRNKSLVFSAVECSSLSIKYCIFEQNSSLKISCFSWGSLGIFSSLFTNNYGTQITTINDGLAHGTMVNNTFFNNHMKFSGPFEFCNNILYVNDIDTINIIPDGFVANNLIEGGLELIQDNGINQHVEGNIDLEPLFVDTLNNDFHLKAQSPCINYKGISNLYEHLWHSSLDLDGNPRIYGICADIGAYEYQGTPDNRPPIIPSIRTPKILPGIPRAVTIRFMDPDSGDICSISEVISESPEIKADILSSDSVSVKINITAEAYFEGPGHIQVRVMDNHGHLTSYNLEVIVSRVVCGDVVTNTVWGGDTVKVECDVTIGQWHTLTIQPGTTITFRKNCRLIVLGSLIAIGNDSSRITFTSSDTNGFSQDDYVGWGGISTNRDAGQSSSAIFRYCDFLYSTATGEYGSTIYWRTMENYGYSEVSLIVDNCNFVNNRSQSNGGALFLHSYAVLTNNTFSNNISYGSGGAVYLDYYPLEINNCKFFNNHAESGGAIFKKASSGIANCLFVGNSANVGGAIASNENLTLLNNTFYHNYAGSNGGGVYFLREGNIFNCIFWNNNAGISGNEIKQDHFSLLIKNSIFKDGLNGISYSEIQPTNTLYSENPGFINSLANDFHLSDSSFAINSGTTEVSDEYLPFNDLDGNPRIADLYVDIGAYEYHSGTFNIWQHPQAIRACNGSEGQLITNASGGVTGYQWQKNGYDLPGATDRILFFPSLDTSQTGLYRCKVLSVESEFYTDTIPVIVDLPVTISGQTESFIACEHTDTLLFLQSSGDLINEFSWMKDGLILVSENQSKLLFPSLNLSDKGIYTGILYNTCSADTSEQIEIQVKPIPHPDLGSDTAICLPVSIVLAPKDAYPSYLWNTGSQDDTILVESSGVFTLTVADTNGCSNTDTIRITAFPLPFLYLGNDTSISTNDTLFLNAGEGFENYNWSSGDDSQFLMVHMEYTGENEYWVLVTDTNGCTAVDSIVIKVLPKTNSTDNSSKITLKAYPNPTAGILHILSESIVNEVRIEIFDMKGILVYQKKIQPLISGENFSINLSFLQPGIYELRVGEKNIRVVKL